MADATMTSPAPRKRRNWLRIIAWVLGVFLVLLIVAYFVGTSSAVFTGIVLPKVSAALNANVTVSDVTIHPFSEVVLSNLKVQTTGSDPLVSVAEVRARYSLMDIIKGNIHVDEVTVKAPTVVLVQNPDGTSNLDPILKAMQQQPAKAKPEAKSSKPPQIDVRKITVTDGTVRQVKLYASNHRDTTELSHLNINLTDLKNGQTGKLTLSSDIAVDNNPPAPATNGMLNAKLSGNFNFALGPDLSPGSVQGNTRLEVARAGGALAQIATLAANLDCDVTPTEVRQIALRFQQGATPLGQIRVSGPFDLQKTEGKLNIEVSQIDKNLLNLAGASSGIDFGPTTINSTNQIQLAKGGSAVTATGQFNLNQLQVSRANQTTPPLSLSANYDVSLDRAANNTVLRAFTVNGTQKGKSVIAGQLTSPMTISSNGANGGPLSLAVTHLDLADWKPFLGDVAPAGDVNMKLQLLSEQGGTNLTFDLTSEIDNLTAGSGSNQITQATITLALHGKATEMKHFDFPQYKFELARAGQSLLSASGSGTYDKATSSADVQLAGQLMLAKLLQAFPQPNMNVSAGTVNLTIHLAQKPQPGSSGGATPPTTQDVTGNLALADLTGKIGNNTFQSFGTTADLDVGATPQTVQIRKISGKITQGANAGGTFNLSGTYGLSNKVAQLTAKMADFNQNGLRPFLEPSLGDKKLVSVALNANASVNYDPAAASDVKADLQVTNLVVNDPRGQFPATPLETRMQVDASLNKQQIAEIRQCQVALTPTARATNQIQLTGKVDMSQTNAIQGNLKLVADSLDLTSYYDLFGGQKASNATPATPAATTKTQTSAASDGGQQELGTNQLPLRNFVAEANVGRVYLHEVDIKDFQTTTKIDGGHVIVNPFKLTLNGAPVNTTVDVDMGVPGYKYAFGFNAQAIPLAPLVNTFQPDRKGQVGGTLTAQAQINGIGTTGTNLQRNLAGQFDVSSTNLNLSVINIRSPLLRTLINVVATIPDLARNPESAVGNLLGALTPGNKTGGLSGELEKSPVEQIAARGSIGSGQVRLQQAMVQSSAFEADANGTITLAPILTNSPIQIPVSVSLSRSIADRVNLVPANAPTNAAYVKLPDFLTMRGTVGQPKSDINKLALAGTVFRGISGVIPNSGKSGNLMQGLGSLLGGTSSAPNTNAAPNQPSTNQSPVGNLLNQFLKPRK
jgi:hypothetical protein